MRHWKYILCLLAAAVMGVGGCIYYHDGTVQSGPYHPHWFSLTQYDSAPDWFRDAKFGIRVLQDDSCRQPDSLVALCRRAGARYIVVTDSRKDILNGWEQAARANGLRLGLSLHTGPYGSHYQRRAIQMINRFRPDILCFGKEFPPMLPDDETALSVIAHFYNRSYKQTGRKNEAVVFADIQTEYADRIVVPHGDPDMESPGIVRPKPWQACLGPECRSALTVVQTLADVISRNGCLLLDLPLSADGTLDPERRTMLEEVADWMEVNAEAVFGTRPFESCGEGPDLRHGGGDTPVKEASLRFVQQDDMVYAHVLAWPEGDTLTVKSFAPRNYFLRGIVTRVELLGYPHELEFSQEREGLQVLMPRLDPPSLTWTLKMKTIY